MVNPASAWLTAVAILIYVVGYTMILKRRTPQNIVWGGAAGCMPVLIGWSAVTGGVSWTAVLLFGVIFFWTPPHYWPLSMKFRSDYAAAGVPMLPVVAKDTKVAREMIAYTVAMIACSLLLVPVQGMTWVYGVVADRRSGGWFLWSCIGLLRRAEDPEPRQARGDERVPRVDHVPDAAVRRDRGGRLPAVLTSPMPCDEVDDGRSTRRSRRTSPTSRSSAGCPPTRCRPTAATSRATRRSSRPAA